MNGHELKLVLKLHYLTGRDLAEKMGKNKRTVYGWFALPFVKPKLLAAIEKATGVKIIRPEDSGLRVQEDSGPHGRFSHHGHKIAKQLELDGIKKERFAENMNMSLSTLIVYWRKGNGRKNG